MLRGNLTPNSRLQEFQPVVRWRGRWSSCGSGEHTHTFCVGGIWYLVFEWAGQKTTQCLINKKKGATVSEWRPKQCRYVGAGMDLSKVEDANMTVTAGLAAALVARL